ncbi:hypothetical protein ACMATS_06455 [Streptoverticillium reticulum]|uniref:hypothetical protein n=1 Tax=Streptoverticillium reticulum TaxID=1433415 RepID=UPI0039BFA305
MGAIQQPTKAMGPYRIEIRSESFYLTRTDAKGCASPDRHTATVPASDAPALIASFAQVASHPAWKRREWAGGDPTDTTWTLPPDGQGEAPSHDWSVSRDGETLTIKGPWVVHAENERALLDSEIRYLDLPQLGNALKALGDEPAAS